MAISHKAVDYSVKRIRDFKQVNKTKSTEEKHECIDLLASSFGMDIDYLISVMSTFYDEAGFVVVGVLLGLFMSEYERENEVSSGPTSL